MRDWLIKIRRHDHSSLQTQIRESRSPPFSTDSYAHRHRQCGAGDPYPIDTLFLFMANMGWNSAMNPGDHPRSSPTRTADGSIPIPHVIYSDAYCSETVAYADLVLPDTTYLER